MSTTKSWIELERTVRSVASFKWICHATAETVNGVKVDCVLKPATDKWVCIEITEEQSLEKLRGDLAKFATVRPYLFSQNIYSDCYFITRDLPPPSIVVSAKGHNVTALSLRQFESLFLDYERYSFRRSTEPFGSAIDPVTGNKDKYTYVPVKYEGVTEARAYSVSDIATLIRKGQHVILLGHFGAGKSRCVQEIFHELTKVNPESLCYPIAINLRDHWGNKKASELIRRHLDDLGLSDQADSLIHVLGQGPVLVLLDGFDELGIQQWSEDAAKLRDSRWQALAGVRDLVGQLRGGMLITGREHYFNSDDELLKSLGVAEKYVQIRCADEFSTSEMQQYLDQIAKGVTLPSWLPRRPLVCQIIALLNSDEVKRLIESDTGEYEFWGALLDAICKREKRINQSLDESTIRQVLMRIARSTRAKPDNVGPITLIEISKAFESITGSTPTQDSITMLNRLPSLGRVSSESGDRQFIDIYFLDGLRAEDLRQAVYEQSEVIKNEIWRNPLDRLGLSILAQDIQSGSGHNLYFKYMRYLAKHANQQAACDIANAMIACDRDIDFEGLELNNCKIGNLDLSDMTISNLSISECEIDALTLSPQSPKGVYLRDCTIDRVIGVSDSRALPDWVKDCEVGQFDTVNTISRIKLANLNPGQTILVGIIKKTFFQPGAGRQEVALFRGFGNIANAKLVHKIVNRLLTDKILTKSPGYDGLVYHPVRSHTRRMDQILSRLTLSDDPLWVEVSTMK